MKRLIVLFLLIYQISYCQTLFVGVTTTVNLATALHNGSPQGICYDWTISHWSNCVYASGMKLYVRVDSIVGPPNSVKITRFPDYSNTLINANDTIRIKPGSSDIYVYYNNVSTLYVSLVAIGTPSVYGESYYCNFSKAIGAFYDGCGPAVVWFSGGNGALDTVKNCIVTMSTGNFSEQSKYTAKIFPNPTNDYIFIETGTNDKQTVDLYDIDGRHVFHKIVGNKSNIDMTTLNEGVYSLTIKTVDHTINKKIILLR